MVSELDFRSGGRLLESVSAVVVGAFVRDWSLPSCSFLRQESIYSTLSLLIQLQYNNAGG